MYIGIPLQKKYFPIKGSGDRKVLHRQHRIAHSLKGYHAMHKKKHVQELKNEIAAVNLSSGAGKRQYFNL